MFEAGFTIFGFIVGIIYMINTEEEWVKPVLAGLGLIGTFCLAIYLVGACDVPVWLGRVFCGCALICVALIVLKMLAGGEDESEY